MEIPRHIAVVMDGNGRWAEERGMPRLQGHIEGRHATRRAVEAAAELGVEVLSVYAFSVENWRRPIQEVEGLFELIEASLQEELSDLVRNNIRLRPTGRLGELPDGLQEALFQVRQETATNDGMVLNLLINYGGRAEIVDAAREWAKRVARGEADPEELNEEVFAELMYAPDLPDPDVLLRPGGENRLSNFLLWEVAYAEIIVMPVLWPDFQQEHLEEAVAEYNRRQRRFGGVVSSPGKTDVNANE